MPLRTTIPVLGTTVSRTPSNRKPPVMTVSPARTMTGLASCRAPRLPRELAMAAATAATVMKRLTIHPPEPEADGPPLFLRERPTLEQQPRVGIEYHGRRRGVGREGERPRAAGQFRLLDLRQ